MQSKNLKNVKNIRETKQRQLVLDVVINRCDHPTADMIYEVVRKKDNKISKGTVYRNLNMLTSMGKITHVEVPGGDRFDSTLGLHYHVVCTSCGVVEDVPIAYDFKSDKKIEKKTGFNITGHSLIYEGLCPRCKSKKGGKIMKKIFLSLAVFVMVASSLSFRVLAIDDMEMLQRIGNTAYYRDMTGTNHTIGLDDFNSDGEINILDALLGVEQLKMKIYIEYSTEIYVPGLINNNYKVTVSSGGSSFDYQVDKATADDLIAEAKSRRATFVGRTFDEVISGQNCHVNLVCYYISDARSSFIVKVGVPG